MALALFSYRKGSTLIHKLPASFKLLFLMILCIVTFAGGSYDTLEMILSKEPLLRISICFFISTLLFILSGADLRSLKPLKFVLILGIAVIVFRMFSFSAKSDDLNYLKVSSFLFINLDGLASGILYTIRFFITSLAAQIVFETTSSLQIKYALENLQQNCAKVFPPLLKWNPALAISLAINFIPQIFETWNKIHLASLSRSNVQKKKNIIQSAFILYSELQALLSCLLRQAETTRQAILNRS